MADIDAKTVMALRKQTGAPMMDCKAALKETGGDMDKAVALLREKGLAAAARKAGREARIIAKMNADEFDKPGLCPDGHRILAGQRQPHPEVDDPTGPR